MLRHKLWRESERFYGAPTMGADCGGMCEYMTDKIISDPDTITTSGYAGRESRYRRYPRLHFTPRYLNILKLSLYHGRKIVKLGNEQLLVGFTSDRARLFSLKPEGCLFNCVAYTEEYARGQYYVCSAPMCQCSSLSLAVCKMQTRQITHSILL